MIDGFASAGVRHVRARRARGRRERWLARLVEDVRSGAATVPAGSAVEVVSYHRDVEGRPLDARVAAVELLNIIRPTVAISLFLAFSGHALALWPQHRERLAGGDPAFAEAWAHEVRRFYPFVPILGGKTPAALEVGGEQVRKGAMVVLDVYGQLHDGELWEEPYAFRPERFLDREIGAFDLIPQGGGDPRTGHRCPGEQIVVAVLGALAVRLARLDAELPPQDLDIALHRIPALPASRIRLRVGKSGVAGSAISRTLNCRRASTMALMTAAGAAVVGPSPADLMPSGFVGERTSTISVCKLGRSSARGMP